MEPTNPNNITISPEDIEIHHTAQYGTIKLLEWNSRIVIIFNKTISQYHAVDTVNKIAVAMGLPIHLEYRESTFIGGIHLISIVGDKEYTMNQLVGSTICSLPK